MLFNKLFNRLFNKLSNKKRVERSTLYFEYYFDLAGISFTG